MTNTSIRQTVDELKKKPLCDSTLALRSADTGYDSLAKSAAEKISVPTILLTRAEHFEKLIPKCLHRCPAFIIWLPDDFSGDVFDLAHITPEVHNRTSLDLTECDPVIKWECSGFAFTAFAHSLTPSFVEQQVAGAIVVIFATSQKTSITAIAIDAELQEQLNHHWDIWEDYAPNFAHTEAELKAAAGRRVDPHEFELDARGNRVILLRPRRAVRPDRLV